MVLSLQYNEIIVYVKFCFFQKCSDFKLLSENRTGIPKVNFEIAFYSTVLICPTCRDFCSATSL